MSILTGEVLRCDICGHQWLRCASTLPYRCPSRKCRSSRWNHGVYRQNQCATTEDVYCMDCGLYRPHDAPMICPACGSDRWHPDSKEVRFAHSAVPAAVKRGKLVRQPCEECGAANANGHHEDYSKPLEVRWLCHRHHRLRHLEIKRESKAREDAALATMPPPPLPVQAEPAVPAGEPPHSVNCRCWRCSAKPRLQ